MRKRKSLSLKRRSTSRLRKWRMGCSLVAIAASTVVFLIGANHLRHPLRGPADETLLHLGQVAEMLVHSSERSVLNTAQVSGVVRTTIRLSDIPWELADRRKDVASGDANVAPIVRLDGADLETAVAGADLELRRRRAGCIIHVRRAEESFPIVVDDDLPTARVGSIVVRLRQELGTRVVVEWRNADGVLGEVAVPTAPFQGSIKTYEIAAERLFESAPKRQATVGELRLRPSNVPGDDVVVERVEVGSGAARYPGTSGKTSLKIGGERRDAIFMRIPGSLVWRARVTEGATFDVGVATPADIDGARWSITIGEPQTGAKAGASVLSGDLGSTWSDQTIDLAAWADREVEVRLSCETSGEDGIVFWSNPRIRGPERRHVKVILVLEDALRADHLQANGYGRNTTQAKSRFFNTGGVSFVRAVSQATWTRPSVPALMTGLLPSATGVWQIGDQLSGRFVTIAEILRAAGMETVSFYQNTNAGPLVGLDQGFDESFGPEVLGTSTGGQSWDVIRHWLEDHRKSSFFAYVHLLDPHGVYDPPPEWRGWYREVGAMGSPVEKNPHFDPEWVAHPTTEGRKALYDGEIANNDCFFADLVASLDRLGILDETVLVHVSDHGEFLGEHGLWGHEPPSYMQGVNVPLTFWAGGRFSHRVVTAPVQLIDVMPTLVELVGGDASTMPVHGRSLVPLLGGADETDWMERLVIVEEVMRRRKEPEVCGSLILGDRHYLFSERIWGDSLIDRVFRRARHETLTWPVASLPPLLVFRVDRNGREHRTERLAAVDPLRGRSVWSILQRIDEVNREVREVLATEGQRPITREELKRLEALGYLQGDID